MKKSLALASLAVLSLTLSGCFKSPAEIVTEKAAEKMVEKAIEAGSGGQVDANLEDGKMTITDGENKVEMNNEGGSMTFSDGESKVDVNTEDGTMTMSDGEGKTQIATGGKIDLPENFPKELVVADDARLSVATDLGKTMSVTYLTQAEMNVMIDAYKQVMTDRGWKKTLETIMPEISMLGFEKGGQSVSCVVSPNENKDEPEKTMVNLTLNNK